MWRHQLGRRELIGIGAAAAIGLLAGGPAIAQQSLVIKASDVHAMDYPTVQAIVEMGQKLEKATNGRLSIKMFPSMQLGGEKEALEQVQVGALGMTRVSVGVVGPIVDDLNVFNMPYLFRSIAHMDKVLDGPIGDELLAKLTKGNLIGLGWMDAGARSFYDSKRPIRTPADLRGLKVRVMGNPMFVEMANAMGGNGISMGFDELYSALQTGVVDGAENNSPSYLFDNHYQVAKYYSLTEHLMVPEIFVFSKKIWDPLSSDDQKLIRTLSRETQLRERALWNAREHEAMEKLKAQGVQIITVDKTPLIEAVKPLHEKYGAKYAALIKQIEAVQ